MNRISRFLNNVSHYPSINNILPHDNKTGCHAYRIGLYQLMTCVCSSCCILVSPPLIVTSQYYQHGLQCGWGLHVKYGLTQKRFILCVYLLFNLQNSASKTLGTWKGHWFGIRILALVSNFLCIIGLYLLLNKGSVVVFFYPLSSLLRGMPVSFLGVLSVVHCFYLYYHIPVKYIFRRWIKICSMYFGNKIPGHSLY